MYHGPIGITTGLITTGVTAAVILPKSRSIHLMALVVGLCMLIGLIALTVSTIYAVRHRTAKK